MELLLSACMIHGSVSKVYAKSKKKIMIGHGTVGEKGKTSGTKPGDQSGKEVCTSKFSYKKGSWSGWTYVARANDAETARLLARAMKQACKNNKIDYGKNGPHLYDAAMQVNFDLSKITTKVNCDCFSLVEACLAAAGVSAMPDALRYNDSFTIYTGIWRS